MRQRESQLMRKHTNLPPMVRLVSNHVAQHLHPNRPRLSPAIPLKHRDPPAIIETLSQHLPTPSRTLRQSRTSLRRSAVRTVKLRRNLQVRSRKPHPLGAHIVHMRKNSRNRPNPTGRFSSPDSRVKMLDKNLIHPIIDSKHLHCRSAELSVNPVLTRGHGPLLLDLYYWPNESTLRVIAVASLPLGMPIELEVIFEVTQ